MNDREFEEFILLQVKRSQSIHAVGRWVYLLLAAAGLVIFIIGMSMHRGLSGGLPILVMSVGFLPASIASKKAADSYGNAAEEIAEGLAQWERDTVDNYTDSTKTTRQNACKTLKSTKGLIVSYGIIALMCWIGSVIVAWAADPGGPDFMPGIFALSFVLVTIAVILTILTIKSIRDLPMADRYAQWLKDEADSGTE